VLLYKVTIYENRIKRGGGKMSGRRIMQRSRWELILDILGVISDEGRRAKKTRIIKKIGGETKNNKKMKRMRELSIVVIVAMLLLTAATIASAHTEDDPFTTNLIAGGGNVNSAIDAGDVLVWNDSDNLYVKYVTDGWCLTETHLHIDISPDEIPQTNGNPIPGQFDYKTEHDCVTDYVTEYTYEIPLDGYYGQKLSIAAHAEVCKPGEGEREGEGGFAQGVINTTRLLAGQHIDSGTVTVAIEGENLVVTYETKDGWNLTETQLYVGTTKPEDHSPGQFPYKHSPIPFVLGKFSESDILNEII
jgi:hypothetical protein